ncbi:MAG: helix-turn-helix domain-containing protein [Pseudomonadota bacterium]
MYYQEFLPSKPLRQYIHLFGILENNTIFNETVDESMPPFLCKGLMFHYEENRDVAVSRASYQGELPLGYFMLDNKERFVTSYKKKFSIASVLFKPGKFRYFFPFDTAPLTNQYLTFTSYNEPTLVELHEQILSAKSTKARIQLLDRFFLKMLPKVTSSKEDYTELILQDMFSDEEWKLYKTATSLNISERHLRRLFKREMGHSPKEYHRLLRFSKALAHINTGQFTTLTKLAYALGYSEQKHFILDFKHFIGLTPSQYIHKVSPINHSIAWREEVSHGLTLTHG